MTLPHRLSLLAILAAAALGLAACGGSDDGNAAATSPADEPPEGLVVQEEPAPDADGDAPRLPDVTVTEIDGGGDVKLSSLAPAEKPLLVWFWAPHCPTCNAEAPEVETFTKEHADTLTVVGLGAQDSLEEAEEFVAEHGVTTPQMLYDPTFKSWQHFGINGQPAAILFDREGVARELWFGPFDEDEVLTKARALA